MNPDNQAAKRLFEAARQLASPEQRAAFLQVACGQDAGEQSALAKRRQSEPPKLLASRAAIRSRCIPTRMIGS